MSCIPVTSSVRPTPFAVWFRKFGSEDVFCFRLAFFFHASEIKIKYLFLSSENIFQMASNVNEEETFQCSKCDQCLDWTSKTLPCLHSFCRPCLEMILWENSPCPQCQEPVTSDKLRLAPFLVKSLRRRHLESSEWRCGFCSEDGVESAGQIWCKDCEKLLCRNCNRVHKKMKWTHSWEDLSGKERVEAIRVIMMDDCRRHQQSKDAFCQRCNVCLCDACYKEHVTTSPQCPPRPLSVREEASKEKEEGGPALEQELREFEIHIRATNEQMRRSIDQLSMDCDSECSKLCQDFETYVEEARVRLGELCDNMREMSSELERKWRSSLKERDDLLKKVKIWRHTVRHLLTDDADDEDVVCGLRLVRSELSAWHRQSFATAEKGHWVVTFPKWCHDSLESLKKEMIDWMVETSGHLQLESECRLQGSNQLWILSIIASDEDNRVFVGDWNSSSIQEFGDSGELVGQCHLTDGGKKFTPFDTCRLSKDILVVCGLEFLRRGEEGTYLWGSGRLFFLARKKCPPFLEIQKTIDTKEKKFFSLCQINKKIFACEMNFQKIVYFNEIGEEIKTIHPGRAPEEGLYSPRLRADPTTGNLWGTRFGKSEIFVWKQNGEILQKLEIKERIFDFCENRFGLFYFPTQEGIFSLLPEKKLYKFPKKSENFPRIFVSHQKLFILFKNDGINFMKILKIY